MAARFTSSLFSSIRSLSSVEFFTRSRSFHSTAESLSRRSKMTEKGPVQIAVHEKLTSALKPEYLDVINESSMHNTAPGAESHFKVVIVSSAFESISRIKKHQLVHQAIKEELEDLIHALSIVAKTPKEWEANPNVGKSPPCQGGAGL